MGQRCEAARGIRLRGSTLTCHTSRKEGERNVLEHLHDPTNLKNKKKFKNLKSRKEICCGS